MNSSVYHGNTVSSNRILYTPSVFARTNLLHLQETGTVQAKEPHVMQREHLASYLFFIVKEGSGTLEYDGNTYPLKQNDCVFIDCQKKHSHCSNLDELWILNWMHFYGPNMSGIYDKFTERSGTPAFHTESPEQYITLLDEVFSIASSDNYIRDMQLYEKITTLLTYLMEDSWNPGRQTTPSRQKQNVQEVKDYIDAHFTEKLTLDNLADRFFINKFYLSKIFKEQFGTSINSYLLQVRVTHAKRLLRFSELSIEQIGYECGISDANYFSRMFKKIEGISPGEYRRKW